MTGDADYAVYRCEHYDTLKNVSSENGLYSTDARIECADETNDEYARRAGQSRRGFEGEGGSVQNNTRVHAALHEIRNARR